MADNSVHTYRPVPGHSGGACWALNISLFESNWSQLLLQRLLPADRFRRLQSFYFLKDRIRTAGAEVWLRLMLSSTLNIPPRELDIVYEEFKKPWLRSPHENGSHYFNVSHSGEWLLIALSTAGEIGVDVEQTERMTAELMDSILADDEKAGFTGKNPGETLEMLTRYWVGKEAYTKLIGQGITIPLTQLVIPDIHGVSRLSSPTSVDHGWVYIDTLDSTHCWALSCSSPDLCLQMSERLILVREIDFLSELRPYLTGSFTQ